MSVLLWLVCVFKGKCGYIYKMAKVNMPHLPVGASRDDSAVYRMPFFFLFPPTVMGFEDSVVHMMWMW